MEDMFTTLHFIIIGYLITLAAGTLFQYTPAPEFYPAPYNVSFHRGDVAVLSCSIYNLGTKTVVWRRIDSSFPLTSGTMTVIEDKRIQVAHIEFKNQWDLTIKDVKPEDDGVYECQISSKDRTVRRIITLNVVERKVEIPEINITEPQYIERGEKIVLQCNATGEYYPPDEIDWFRNGHKITTNVSQGVQISKDYIFEKKTFTSVLKIDRARMQDDGTYVCRASNMQITNTKVTVLNAETSQVKRGTAGGKLTKNDSSLSRSSSSQLTCNSINMLNIFTLFLSWILVNSYCNS